MGERMVPTAKIARYGQTEASDGQPQGEGSAGRFGTVHLRKDLKVRSVRGGLYTLSSQAIQFFIQVASTAILARILTPNDFGLVAMVTAFTGFVGMLKDAGLSMATIQRSEITHDQVSTLFWVNVALSTVIMVATILAAPLVAWFYSEPRLLLVTIVIAGTFLVGGLSVQHQALLSREMRFGVVATVDVVSKIGGTAIGITMAAMGFGYWALVGLAVSTSITNSILLWLSSGWLPGPPRRGCGLRSMLAFGGNLTAASVLGYARRNLDNVLIGATWGAGALGLYSKAYHLITLPISQINAPITAVAVPALSRLQGDREAYRRFYRRFIEGISVPGFPFVFFALAESEAIVALVLGTQWGDAVPIFRALVPAGLVGVLNVAGGVVCISMGRSDRHLKATVVSSLLVLFGFLVGLPYGALGVAIAFSVTFVGTFPIVLMYSYQDSPVSFADLGTSVWRPLAASFLAFVVLLLLQNTWKFSVAFVQIICSLLIFLVLYVSICIVLPGGRSFLARQWELLTVMKRRGIRGGEIRCHE